MKEIEFRVVGLRYRVTEDTLQEMSEVLPLKAKLEREPDNPHDENAIKVVLLDKPWKDFHIGYLHREVAKTIAPKWDAVKVEISEGVIAELDPNEAEATITLKMKSLQTKGI